MRRSVHRAFPTKIIDLFPDMPSPVWPFRQLKTRWVWSGVNNPIEDYRGKERTFNKCNIPSSIRLNSVDRIWFASSTSVLKKPPKEEDSEVNLIEDFAHFSRIIRANVSLQMKDTKRPSSRRKWGKIINNSETTPTGRLYPLTASPWTRWGQKISDWVWLNQVIWLGIRRNVYSNKEQSHPRP